MASYKDIVRIRNEYMNSSSLSDHEFNLIYGKVTGNHFNPVDAEETSDNNLTQLVRLLNQRMAGESVNKKCVESLIKAGTFTEFPETRATLIASFEIIYPNSLSILAVFMHKVVLFICFFPFKTIVNISVVI